MPCRAVIFDLDGTLLNTLEDLAASTNAALAAFSMPLRTVDEVRRMVGNGIGKLIARAVPADTDEQTAARVLEAFKTHYAAHALDRTALYPQAVVALEGLKRVGIPCAVVSNKADFAVQTLHETFFRGLVTASFGERPGYARKPDPALTLLALSELGVPREEAVYVGDSDVDAVTAKNAGMPGILVDWGFRPRSLLETFGLPVVSTGEALLEALRNAADHRKDAHL